MAILGFFGWLKNESWKNLVKGSLKFYFKSFEFVLTL